MLKRRVRSCWKEGFKSVSHVWKKSIKWLIFLKKVQFIGAYQKSVQFFGSYQKSVQFFDSYVFKNLILRDIFFKKVNSVSDFLKKGSILWIFLKGCMLWVVKKRVFDSSSCFSKYLWVKRGSILWVILKKRVQFFETYFPQRIN